MRIYNYYTRGTYIIYPLQRSHAHIYYDVIYDWDIKAVFVVKCPPRPPSGWRGQLFSITDETWLSGAQKFSPDIGRHREGLLLREVMNAPITLLLIQRKIILLYTYLNIIIIITTLDSRSPVVLWLFFFICSLNIKMYK